MFASNGYPKSVIDKYVNQFMNSKFNPQMKAPKEDTVIVHMSLPLYRETLSSLGKKVKDLI